MRHIRTLAMFLVFFIMLSASTCLAVTEQRIALVIGNSAYSFGPLKNPVNDATDMAATLKKLGFNVTMKKNAKLHEMDEAIEAFGNKLKKGGVGLFFYAGHGVQVNGVNYLIPVDARINKESDVKYKAMDVNKILDEMANANNGLNIVILDACRDNPFTRSFRNATRGLAIVSTAPTGTFISYSTSPGNVARDGEGRNSPYTKALIKYMQEPEVSITDVFMNVRKELREEIGQVPWELSSLEGKFYFNSGRANKVAEPIKDIPIKEQEGDDPSSDLDEGQQKIDEGKANLKAEKKETATTYPHAGVWEGLIETYGGLFERPVTLPIEVKVINDRFLSSIYMYNETRTLTGTVDRDGTLINSRLEGSVQKYNLTGKLWEAYGEGRMGWKLRLTLKKRP